MDSEFVPCDTCRARSYVFVEMPNDLELAYCAHHATEYWTQLNVQAQRVIDLRHMIPTGRAQERSMVG